LGVHNGLRTAEFFATSAQLIRGSISIPVNVISKFFRGATAGEPASEAAASRITRRSNGLGELSRSLRRLDGLRVLDLGPTSPQNIAYFTGIGHRIHNEDVLLAARDPGLLVTTPESQPVPDVARFLAENLLYDQEFFDAVLCWDLADYLHADLVKPVVRRIHRILRPQGLLLGFFHTRDAGPNAPCHRYHIGTHDTLELQCIPLPAPGQQALHRHSHLRLQRVFNNRHIENLFHDFSSIKFFLGRDHMREVLVVR
jgi:SAM-dependent methyltransferase